MCNGKAVTPGTDNFEIAPFVYEGVTYYSAEQFYQALKMKKAADRGKLARCVPKPNEKAWDHGMRAWQAGQLGVARKDWEAVKVEAMYFANRVKLQQNPALLTSLLESNGAPQGNITHMGSGKFWDKWNPILLMLLREELSPGGGEPGRVAEYHRQMDAYREEKRGQSLLAELMAADTCLLKTEAQDSGSSRPEQVAAAEDISFDGNSLQLFRHSDVCAGGSICMDSLAAALQKVDDSWTQEELDSRTLLDACEQMSAC